MCNCLQFQTQGGARGRQREPWVWEAEMGGGTQRQKTQSLHNNCNKKRSIFSSFGFSENFGVWETQNEGREVSKMCNCLQLDGQSSHQSCILSS